MNRETKKEFQSQGKLFPLRLITMVWTRNQFRITWPILVVLGMAVLLGAFYSVGERRGPIEITYCLLYANPGTSEHGCLATKSLKIPRAYEGDGYQFNFGTYTEHGSIPLILEVAYPSMLPWQSLPWSERSSTQKIELQLRGIGRAGPLENKEQFFYGSPKAVHIPEPLLGLNAYEKDAHLILVPFDPIWKIGVECTNGQYPKKPASGLCWAISNNDWDMLLFYYHEQVLLPEWRNVNAKVFALVNSFVVSP